MKVEFYLVLIVLFDKWYSFRRIMISARKSKTRYVFLKEEEAIFNSFSLLVKPNRYMGNFNKLHSIINCNVYKYLNSNTQTAIAGR